MRFTLRFELRHCLALPIHAAAIRAADQGMKMPVLPSPPA
jgi:hypothetical protein